MKKITRRSFIKQSIAGSAAVIAAPVFAGKAAQLEIVELGITGIQTSCLAMGTGTHGGRNESNQTRMGLDNFVRMAKHAYDSGIRFFESADMYGSHTFVREALKYIPRKEITLMTKIWVRPRRRMKPPDIPRFLERACDELGTETIDIVMLHCLESENWVEEYSEHCENLIKAKEKGIIRAHGVSCHSLPALKTAVQTDWTDIVQARINHTGLHMDGEPEEVVTVLKQASKNKKGVIGMKIFGQGDMHTDTERQKSLEFVYTQNCVDAITIGFEATSQIDDAIARIQKISG
ncbi:aldo/keto reductase [candidate division KSB1 bacterium]|nr:aldo/keto reductase [candidate division KSB1 bacterium]